MSRWILLAMVLAAAGAWAEQPPVVRLHLSAELRGEAVQGANAPAHDADRAAEGEPDDSLGPRPGEAGRTGPADSFERDLAVVLSDYGTVIPSVAAGAMLLGGSGSDQRLGEAATLSIGCTTLATHLLKATIDSPRPNRPEVRNGFPSGHTSLVFTFARSVAEHDSGWGAVAYAWAAGVGWSRVRLGDHDTAQVLAGAALGWFIADQIARERRPTPGPTVAATSHGVGVGLRW